MDEEKYLISCIRNIQQSANEQMKPYIDRLNAIQGLKPISFVIDEETAKRHFILNKE